MSERQFFDGTTYSSPALFLDRATNELWNGPVMPESNIHWGKCEGFDDHGQPIFVYRCSELPDGDYIRIKTEPHVPPEPKTREDKIQDLNETIGSSADYPDADWD